ncbi:MAG: hypothetical protein ACI9FN_003659, partial [Saprospiraceae bacterium]
AEMIMDTDKMKIDRNGINIMQAFASIFL